MQQKLLTFFKKETILCISGILAICSMFVIVPDVQYIQYINTDVLILLFCLMAIMAGLQDLGLFQSIASALLQKTGNLRQLSVTLCLLCFFFAMLVTNDVALITFVPFTVLVLRMAQLTQYLIPLLVAETISANLGSMLTPIGNPQNLYLYTISGMSALDFIWVMLPLTVLSLFLVLVYCLRLPVMALSGEVVHMERSEHMPIRKKLTLSTLLLLFSACLTTVFRVLPHEIVLLMTLIWFVFFERDVLKRVDYSLLLTFVFFFVFIGNLGRISFIRECISELLMGREILISFLMSQIISNVPAAVLLSGFTNEWKSLLFGVNIGGLGTLIASMASLISYKFFVQEVPTEKSSYMKEFSIVNVVFAIILLVTAYFL